MALSPAPITHVSTSPPSIPDSRISRVRFWPWPSEFFRNRPSRNATMLKCSLTFTPSSFGLPIPSPRLSWTSCPGICVRVRPGIVTTAKCPGPLCQKMGVTHHPDGLLDHLRGHYPSFIAHTGPCARPASSQRLGLPLVHSVFAGCCEPLLVADPSRHYLCHPYGGARTPTTSCPSAAHTHFFADDGGLTPGDTRSAHENFPARRLPQGGNLSRLQSFDHLRAPPLARPPDRSHRGHMTGQPGRLHHA